MSRKNQKTLSNDKYLSKSEVKALLKAVEEKAVVDIAKGRKTWPKVHMMLNLGLQSGLRVSEMANCRVGDFHLGREPFVKVTGKGKRERKVLLSTEIVKLLKYHIQVNRLGDEDFLLNTGPERRKFTVQGIQQQFRRSVKLAGLDPGYTTHCLRHTFATELYQQKKDLRMVAQQLGHADVSTTSIYAQSTKENIYEAMNGLYGDDSEDEDE